MENSYNILQQFNSETVYHILLESTEFYRRYYKNILVSFFLDTIYMQKTENLNQWVSPVKPVSHARSVYMNVLM